VAPSFKEAQKIFPYAAKKFARFRSEPYHPNPSIRRTAARLLRRTGEDLDEL
jgi:hypothetical protein